MNTLLCIRHFSIHTYRKDLECVVSVIREPAKELRRQRISCVQTLPRKLSPSEEPEVRVESQVTLHEPLFLSPGHIYSLYLKGSFKSCQLVWGPFRKSRTKIGNTFIHYHGEGVTAVRELNFITDVSTTWGPRGPEA